MTALSTRLFALWLAFAALLAGWPADSASAQSRDRQDRRMVIINESAYVIDQFYATNTGVKNWGRDLLGQSVIRPGQRYIFNFDDGTGYCLFDFKAVVILANGRPRAIERYRVNVCENVSWTIHD